MAEEIMKIMVIMAALAFIIMAFQLVAQAM
jgi:hypothetical protein